MKQSDKYKEKYKVEDIPTLWLDIQVIRINNKFKYMNCG